MAPTQRQRFVAVLALLERWHGDNVGAQSYDGPRTSHSKPGSKVLFSQSYPGTQDAWDAWRAARSNTDRERVIRDLKDELAALSRRPYRLERFKDRWGKTRYRKAAP